MQYAVLHITKYKTTGGIGAHIDRKHLSANIDKTGVFLNEEIAGHRMANILGRQIDPSKTCQNQHIIPSKKPLSQDVADRIKAGYNRKKALRKDAVKALGAIMTGSHERMKAIEKDPQLFKRWKEANYDFACKEFGKDNIVRFTLHMDEKTPHFHCVFVPLTPDGCLSAKNVMGNRAKLQSLQDKYAQVMQPFGLHRGISTQLTGRVHQTTAEYYKQINQNYQAAQAKTDKISPTNLFNLAKVRKQTTQELASSYATNKELVMQKEHLSKALYSRIGDNMKNDLAQVKKEVNLVQHAASMGYQLDKKKSTRKWAVMEKQADKILVLTRPNSQGYYYYQSVVDDAERGTIVDFMLKRGYSYADIRKLSSLHLDDEVVKYTQQATEKIADPAIAQKLALTKYNAFPTGQGNYLKNRGLAQEVIGMVKANKQAAIFPLHLDGKMCSTITYTQHGKYFQKDLPRGVCLLGNEQAPKKIVITESPIDSLSYEQLKGLNGEKTGDTLYIATCGSLSKPISNEIVRLVKQTNAKPILAFDNDEAGSCLSLKVSRLLLDKGAVQSKDISMHRPRLGKDFNEMLQTMAGYHKQAGMELDEEDYEQKETKRRRARMQV